jgi:hypothetical protein
MLKTLVALKMVFLEEVMAEFRRSTGLITASNEYGSNGFGVEITAFYSTSIRRYSISRPSFLDNVWFSSSSSNVQEWGLTWDHTLIIISIFL